jgi:glycosyltransferase involved in cell wall biosynthesis
VRILHVSASYLPAVRYGGTIVSVHGLCKSLAARGHDVHVFTTSVDGPDDSAVSHGVPVDVDGVKVWYFRSRHARRIYWSPPMARALATRVREFDLVHTHASFLWPMWAAARAAKRAGVPYVVSPRGMIEKGLIARKSRLLKTAWIELIEKRSLSQAAAIHVTSAREAAELTAFGFDLPPLVEIPNGVEPGLPNESAGSPSSAIRAIAAGPPYVLFLGRISWKKGLDRLIRSVPHLSPDLRVVIAGNDDEDLRPVLQAQAEELKVNNRLVFTGAVAGADKRTLLAQARVLVLPSYSENFGNVVVEAMAAGCPVVVTPEVGVAPLVRDAGAGWVVDGDPHTLGMRISELCANPSLMLEMGERGRAVARGQFSWDRVAERMESAYRTVLAGDASSSQPQYRSALS